jgi:magnesium transporter
MAYDPEPIFPQELRDAWPALSRDERLESFKVVPHATADDFFMSLSSAEQLELILAMPPNERRTWMKLLAPDDAVDLVQEAPQEERQGLLAQLDDPTRREVQALMAYAEDDAGGLMNPRFARVRPDMTTDEALAYLRKQTREKVETVYYAYVLDASQKLQGVVSLRQLISAPPSRKVAEVMQTDLVTVQEETDQEAVSRFFAEHALMAIPVVDKEGHMKGIVTVDDIVQVVQEEATEDIQKVGGMEALEAPYFETRLWGMLAKRAPWLMVLWVGQLFTTAAMSHFEDAIDRAVVLGVLVPLIISSGGNSGSQAATLIVRAMALGEVRPRDWRRVVVKELGAGLALGGIIGLMGLVRIMGWEWIFGEYAEITVRLAMTVSASLLAVVLWGTLSGSMLPFALRRIGADPASASAPFVATVVDVSGVIIYFSVAYLFLAEVLQR